MADYKVHEMRLHPTPFEMIRSGRKMVEVRLNDEKRQVMQVGDRIEFTLRPELTEKFQAEIIGLDTFMSFKDAYAAYPPEEYGGGNKDEWELMYKYYSPEDEAKYGVLGIGSEKMAFERNL
jgi:ASC-1-like (ASCH) protein